MKRRFLLIISLILIHLGCQKTKPKEIDSAFYYWKSNFQLLENEKNTLSTNGVKKLYIKFFDISWNKAKSKFQMDAPIRFAEKLPDSCQMIPVVFITNQTMKNLPKNEVDSLAHFILEKISKLSPQKYNELQIDCDWTLSTKQKYFSLLNSLKKSGLHLSATIRLHQVKFYEKTGIPPVERGMLMCYNMSDWRSPITLNSIYSPKLLTQYTERLQEYPLALDVVMPIFHWTVVFRNNRFMFFVNNLSAETLHKNENFEQMLNKQQFTVKSDAQFQNISIRKGDVFRCEDAQFEDILKGSRNILEKISNQKLTFALYHLDSQSISYYSNEQIKELLHINKTLR
ncbi:hypothetical protein LV89_02453 [Arcicella aurantiaca]|uniref:Uncharacterized protein n=1 Tax=Arcicella aurantiaca TaxID=591202 RepID=A0A316E814_9BACT|nr:hypothetical protein [Arcicella aurantiaca]PWK26604.1 hypothetical protein LV89_02453 [Arcicella aurantiaca]